MIDIDRDAAKGALADEVFGLIDWDRLRVCCQEAVLGQNPTIGLTNARNEDSMSTDLPALEY